MAIMATLQMLLKVAEVKKENHSTMNASIMSQSTIVSEINDTSNICDMSNLSNADNSKNFDADHLFSDLDSLDDESLKGEDIFEEDEEQDLTEEKYITADENYDVSNFWCFQILRVTI